MKKQGPLLMDAPNLGDLEIHPGVRFLRFNRPTKKNALTQEIGAHFATAVQAVKNDNGSRVLVITGEGNCFSAGGDFQFLEARCKDTPENNRSAMKSFYDAFLCIQDLPIPVIAAVQGHAIGAGLALALAADLRIVATDAQLGLTFVGLGLHPGMGSTFFARRALTQQRAWWALLTGQVFLGEAAAQWGMFLEALPSKEVVGSAVELANQIASQSPNAIQRTLKTLREADGPTLESVLWKEAAGQALCYGDPDMEEGLLAIKEKRKPRF